MTVLGLVRRGRRGVAVGAVVLGLLGCLVGARRGTAQPAVAGPPVSEDAVTAVASRLRCVVCQNLSVADSPSETARQMRDVIREQLVGGRTPAEVNQYFVERYGEWVLLVPPARGFNLVLWALPFLGLVGGLGAVLVAVRRWSRRSSVRETAHPAPAPADRERIRAELERLRD